LIIQSDVRANVKGRVSARGARQGANLHDAHDLEKKETLAKHTKQNKETDFSYEAGTTVALNERLR